MKANGPLQYGKILHNQFTLLSFLGQILLQKDVHVNFSEYVVQAEGAPQAKAQNTGTGLA